MTDVNQILDAFIKAAEDSVGDLLSTTGEGTNKRPAVLRELQKGAKPYYPYVVLDMLNSSGITTPLETRLTEQGTLEYYHEEVYTLRYRVLAKVEDAYNIARRLSRRLLWVTIRGQLFRDTEGGKIWYIEPIVSVPNLLSTSFLQTQQFNVVFSRIEVEEEPVVQVIESTEIQTSTMKTPDDPNPVEDTIICP